MTDMKAKIAEVLRNDPVIQNLVAVNKPYSGKGTPGKQYSVIPAGLAKGETKGPFITIQAGSANRLSRHLWDELYYIRVYDEETNGTVFIQQLHTRIYELLDGNRLKNVQGGRNLEIYWENSLPEYRDDVIHKHYVEAQYRLQVL